MKFIIKKNKSDKDLKNLRQEIAILQQLDHPNIVRMLVGWLLNNVISCERPSGLVRNTRGDLHGD